MRISSAAAAALFFMMTPAAHGQESCASLAAQFESSLMDVEVAKTSSRSQRSLEAAGGSAAETAAYTKQMMLMGAMRDMKCPPPKHIDSSGYAIAAQACGLATMMGSLPDGRTERQVCDRSTWTYTAK